MTKILVTGSAGFMGSHLVDYLISHSYMVYGIDSLSGGYLENVSPSALPTFHKIDLKNRMASDRFIQKTKPKIIYHLAALASEGLSQFAPIRHTEENYNAYLNLLVPAIKNGLKRIVLCSSMAVYGEQKPPFVETMPRKPADIYGVAKAAMEESTEILSDVFGFEYVILRPHNVYGPRQNLADPYRNVVAIFINSLLRNKPIYIYGDGTQKRAFSYIDDITGPIAQAGLKKGLSGQIVNIGPEKEYTINYLAKLTSQALGSTAKPRYLPKRPQEVQEAYCSSEKAKKLLGFRDKISLEVGLKRMIVWAKSTGPQKPKYLTSLEITNANVPQTWKNKLI